MNLVDGFDDMNGRSLTSVSEDTLRIYQEAEERLTKYENARNVRIREEFSELMQAITNRDLKEIKKIASRRSILALVHNLVLDYQST